MSAKLNSEAIRVTVMLRIFGGLRQLDSARISSTLQLDEADRRVERVEIETGPSASPEHIYVVFRAAPEIDGLHQSEKWGTAAFRSATSWLRSRSPGQFEEFRSTKYGSDVDFLVLEYNGHVPSDLLRELARLQIPMMILHSE